VGSLNEELNPPKSFIVRVSSSGEEVLVAENQSILEALERAKIYPENSCRDGICGTCETRVVSGIPDHRDDLLSDAEQAEGKTMLICISRSLTPNLELDIQ
jgi:ferredoxin